MIDVVAQVLANTRLSDDYNVIKLAAPDVASRVQPGQFVMVKPTTDVTPMLLRRPFSVFEVLRDAAGSVRGLSLLNKRIGVGSGLLYGLEPGAPVSCLGPLGRPFHAVRPPAKAWMVAGGVGLAPFATLAEALVALGTDATLFYGARRGAELFYTDWFAERRIRLALTTEDGSLGDRGFVTVPLAQALASLQHGDDIAIYACGPTPMMRAVAELAARHGRDVAVSLEQVMGCGLGGCYSCVVRVRDDGGPTHYVRSCLAGPVFPASRIVWEELTH
jgi:dihydroorotate dehydrogenase electron transfer subunit